MLSFASALRVAGITLLAFGISLSAAAQSEGFRQAEHLLREGQHQRALETLEHYLASNPRDPNGRFLKGVILSEQKKPQEAIKVYNDLIHEHPDLPEPYNNVAVLHAALGQYDLARAALEMAIRVKPDYATAHENLGDIYARMAAQSYEKAAQFDRGNKSAPLKLKQVTALLSPAQR